MKVRFYFLQIFFLLSFSTFAQQTNTCWSVFRGDKQFEGTTPCTLPESFSLKWIYKSNEKIKSSPVVCKERIVIPTVGGSVISLDIHGKELWKVKKEVSFEAPPILFNNTMYVGSLEGKFYALNATDGQEKWVYNTENQILGSANFYKTGHKSNVVFGCYDNNIYNLNPANGVKQWAYETGNYINGAPAVSNNQIVFGGCDSYLHVINTTNGELIKKIELGTYIASSACIVDNNAYLGNYNGDFMSVNLVKGALNWKINLNQEASVISSPSVIKDKIIIGARDQRVHCLNTTNGKKLWSFKTQGAVDSSPIVDENRVLICSGDGRVYILDMNTGSELFSFDLGYAITGTPAIVDGLIVVAADNGNVYGFKY